MNKKKATPKYLTMKFQKTVKEKKTKTFKRGKTMVTYKGLGIGIIYDYSIAISEALIRSIERSLQIS